LSRTFLRWLLAATLSVALVAGFRLLAADAVIFRPGTRTPAPELFAGAGIGSRENARAVLVTGSCRVEGHGETTRRGGLGVRLAESGRPRKRLSPLETHGFLAAGRPAERPATPPARMDPPVADKATKAARRRRAGEAARRAPGPGFAPQRRRIPGRKRNQTALKAALAPPASLPRPKLSRGAMPADVPAEKGFGACRRVAAPPAPSRLPAPVVPLP